MFGNLLASAVRIVATPIHIVNTVMDKATGGDGSKNSRTGANAGSSPFALLEEIADSVEETCRKADE